MADLPNEEEEAGEESSEANVIFEDLGPLSFLASMQASGDDVKKTGGPPMMVTVGVGVACAVLVGGSVAANMVGRRKPSISTS